MGFVVGMVALEQQVILLALPLTMSLAIHINLQIPYFIQYCSDDM
jgi:hypothetical protein